MSNTNFKLSNLKAINKKGAYGHIEMITSFVLFFLFVLFILVILKPFGTTGIAGSVVADLHDKFEQQASTNLSRAFIKINNTNIDKSCFNISLIDGLFAYALTESYVTNITEDYVFNSSLESVSGSLTPLLVGDNKSEVYYVYISPDFTNSQALSDCTELNNYTLGSIIERQVISYNALITMKDKYDDAAGYRELKNELGIHPNYDFAILIEFDDSALRDTSMQRSVPDTGEIDARAYVKEVLYVDNSGKLNIVSARFNIQVW